MNKMKVLHISEAFGWSGGAAQALFLAEQLNKKGITNFIACPKDGDLYKKAVERNFEVLNFTPKSKMDFKLSYEFSKIYDKLEFDVVHAHHPKAHNCAVLAKFLSKSKPILTVSRRVSHKLPANIFAKLKYKTRLVNAYIPVCEHLKKMLLDYGIEENRIHRVYSGVDTSKYFRAVKNMEFKKSLGLDEKDFVISLVGNFSIDKGQSVFIKALKKLKNNGCSFKAVFAGRNTDTKEFKDLYAASLPLTSGVFLGLRDDVEKILNITDISVNAAIKGEALSGSVRESLACGVPVVASNISGNSEIVKNEVNGFLFTLGDADAMALNIEKLLKNDSLRNDFSVQALKAIEKDFTVEKMAENTLEVYLKYLKR